MDRIEVICSLIDHARDNNQYYQSLFVEYWDMSDDELERLYKEEYGEEIEIEDT